MGERISFYQIPCPNSQCLELCHGKFRERHVQVFRKLNVKFKQHLFVSENFIDHKML